jgi:prepilin-type N-terminal cleavage/methylation domain-containing protein
MKNKFYNQRRAFTLVELLVVISIIGLLSSIAVINLSSARSKARDGKRIADIKQLTTAMQLYYDTNGTYPNTGNTGTLPLNCTNGANAWYCLGVGSAGTCWNGASINGCTALDNALSPYMAKIPKDPDQANVGYTGDTYLYSFALGTWLTPPPILHWGMENGPTTASTCLGGVFGTWPGGSYKDSKYYCGITLAP